MRQQAWKSTGKISRDWRRSRCGAAAEEEEEEEEEEEAPVRAQTEVVEKLESVREEMTNNYPLEDGHTTQTLLTDFYSPWLSCDGVGRSESTQLVRENAPLPLLAVVIPCGMDQTASRVIGLRGGHGNGIIVVVLEDTLEKEEIEGVTVKVVIWSSKKKIFGLEKARLLWRPRMA
ncbi:hypothetical protein C1H76_7442 [Elsinoe australis]|uniref:Uncharacterized protein n=1 Tax=Elsinoe australis TaxID=40998 RepID=A0A4U7AVA1_9PEZI|nr:hypothetical protein C1H76_7442 [Elsinoe australis]